MKRLILAAAMLVAAAAPALAETVVRTVDAVKVFAYLDKYYSMAAKDRSLFTVRYNLRQDGKPATEVKLTLVEGQKRTPIPIGPDGKVERLPTAQEIANKVQVVVEHPKGVKIGDALALDTTIKPATEVDAGECAQAIAQTNAAINRFAGVLGFVAPKVKAVSFVGATSAVAVGADGKTTPLPLVNGVPVYDPTSIKGARTIRLPTAPRLISLE